MATAPRSPRFWALIPAAGHGRRMASDKSGLPKPGLPKQYLLLDGRRVIEHSLSLFTNHARIAGVVVALVPNDRVWTSLPIAASPRIHCVSGGAQRAQSVLAGLTYLLGLGAAEDWVLVHDAARPCLTRVLLDKLMRTLEKDAVGGLLALPAQDTIKRAANGRVETTLDRSLLWQAQTPQMFRLGALHAALAAALQAGQGVTDEASAMEQAGFQPALVEGNVENIKITTPADLAFAEFILQRRQGRKEPA